MDALAVEHAVRPGKVDELEQAKTRVDSGFPKRMERSTACVVDHQDLTGIEFPHHVGPDHV